MGHSQLTTAATRYGLEMESSARQKFEEITGYKLKEVGLVVRPGFEFFGASPDGLFINEDGELCTFEAKCPFKCKDMNIDMDYLEKVVVEDDDGIRNQKTVLKKKHAYYKQVQLQMFVTQSKESHFFVYSSVDYKHVIVKYDEKYC